TTGGTFVHRPAAPDESPPLSSTPGQASFHQGGDRSRRDGLETADRDGRLVIRKVGPRQVTEKFAPRRRSADARFRRCAKIATCRKPFGGSSSVIEIARGQCGLFCGSRESCRRTRGEKTAMASATSAASQSAVNQRQRTE